MTPGLPHQMILEIMSKVCLEMVTIPTKFQVHTKVYTNVTSDDPWVISDDLEKTVRKFGLKLSLHPPSFKFIRKFTNMISDDPWMTSDDLENTVREFVLKLSLYHGFKFI